MATDRRHTSEIGNLYATFSVFEPYVRCSSLRKFELPFPHENLLDENSFARLVMQSVRLSSIAIEDGCAKTLTALGNSLPWGGTEPSLHIKHTSNYDLYLSHRSQIVDDVSLSMLM